jgi:hypothetical protein
MRKRSTVWGGDRDEEARGGVKECGGIAGEGGEVLRAQTFNRLGRGQGRRSERGGEGMRRQVP